MSSNLPEEILNHFQLGRLLDAQVLCTQYIDRCKQEFMEALTLETATNYAAAVLLFSQICATEKKPWKSTIFLDDAKGCMRFMEDFMQDRVFFASTCFSFAAAYEYATFFPEAKEYYKKTISYTTDEAYLNEALFSYLLICLRMDGKIKNCDLDCVKEKVNPRDLEALSFQAKDAYSKLILTDPIEKESKYLDVRYEVERLVDEFMQKTPTDTDNEPFCMRYWTCKKRILSEHFNIEWKSPAECNPAIRFQ